MVTTAPERSVRFAAVTVPCIASTKPRDIARLEKLFERFGQHLEAKGYIARGGQMIDATIVPVPNSVIAATRMTT